MTESALSVDGMFFMAVLGMTAITFALRAGGYWIMGKVPITPRLRRGLEALPGAIIVSTILPMVFQGGIVVGLSILIAVAVQSRLKKEYLAVIFTAIAAAALRFGGLS